MADQKFPIIWQAPAVSLTKKKLSVCLKPIPGKLLAILFLFTLPVFESIGQTCNVPISDNFNSKPILAGNYIWFNAQFKIKNVPACNASNPLTITFLNSTITFVANSTTYQLAVPPGTITFNSSTGTATTNWTSGGGFKTFLPCSQIGNNNIFLTGLAYKVPSGGFPASITPVTWNGQFLSSVEGIEVDWKWSAAVYTQFTTAPSLVPNYNDANIQLYRSGTDEGTPSTYKSYVIDGATGGGGSNYTGSHTGAKTVATCLGTATLPVTFTSFTASRTKEMVKLNWETATEKDCREYVVQLKNGSEWQDITKVASQAKNGNSNSLLKYTFSHPNYSNESSYYRIKQVDLDNTFYYTKIISAGKNINGKEVVVIPNPASDGKISVHFDQPSVRDIVVKDLTGRIILEEREVKSAAWQHNNFAPGLYLIQILNKTTGRSTSDKVIVK